MAETTQYLDTAGHATAQPRSPQVRRDEWLLSLSRLLDRTGENGGRFVGILGVATYTLGSNAFGIAAMMLLYDAAMVIGYIIAGPATDYFGPRKVGILSLLLIGLISFGYQLVPDTIVFLGIMAVLTGIFMGIQSTAFNAYPPYLVPDGELQSFNGMMGAAANIGSILGPLVGGFFVLFFPPRAVFVPYGIMSLASMALLFFLPERITPAEQAEARGRASIGSELEEEHPHGLKATLSYAKDGLVISMKDPALFICLIMGWFGFFAFGAFDSLESLFYRDVLTVSAEWLGWLSAAAGGGTVIGAILMLRFPDKWLSLRGLAVMLLTVGVGTVIYVGTSNVWIACLGQIVLGTGFGAFEPTQALMVQRLTDLAVVGRVLSIMRIGFRFAAVVPLLVAPFLAEAFGVQPVLVTAGIIVTVFGLGFVFGIPKSVNEETETAIAESPMVNEAEVAATAESAETAPALEVAEPVSTVDEVASILAVAKPKADASELLDPGLEEVDAYIGQVRDELLGEAPAFADEPSLDSPVSQDEPALTTLQEHRDPVA